MYQHRRLNPAARQRLARGDDLLDQGPGARVRPGQRADHRPPRHRRGRPARGHPEPHRRWCRRHHRQPVSPEALNPAHQGGDRRRASWSSAVDAPVDRAHRLQPVQRPGEVRVPRRQVAVRAARRARATSSTCAAPRAHPADTDRDVGLQAGARRAIPTSRSARRCSRAGRRPRASQQITTTTSRRAPSSTASGRPASTT